MTMDKLTLMARLEPVFNEQALARLGEVLDDLTDPSSPVYGYFWESYKQRRPSQNDAQASQAWNVLDYLNKVLKESL